MKITKQHLITTGIVVAFAIMLVGAFTSTNNRAISLEEQVISADSNIQIQEKRRVDLIYNLADCVMQYDEHEANTLLAVVEARNDGGTADTVFCPYSASLRPNRQNKIFFLFKGVQSP